MENATETELPKVSCKTCMKIIESMWDGDPTPEEVEALVDHMEACTECESIWQTRRMIEELPEGMWELIPTDTEKTSAWVR